MPQGNLRVGCKVFALKQTPCKLQDVRLTATRGALAPPYDPLRPGAQSLDPFNFLFCLILFEKFLFRVPIQLVSRCAFALEEKRHDDAPFTPWFMALGGYRFACLRGGMGRKQRHTSIFRTRL
ncbi:hypothetical protein CCP2SC5_670003 [Azospirillaceae bacterium]